MQAHARAEDDEQEGEWARWVVAFGHSFRE